MNSRIYSRFVLLVFAGALLLSGRAVFSAAVPARESRVAFCRAMAKVQDGWSKVQVRELLGQPDDVWPGNDSRVMYGDVVWCYGTNGHHTLPTLGHVRFQKGKVSEIVGGWGDPPSPEVICEVELVDALRQIYRPPGIIFQTGSDSQRLIQVSNLLIPKGQEKALAIIGEYDRIWERFNYGNWLFWLVRVMFTSKLPNGIFAVPEGGLLKPKSLEELKKWPTYPVVIIDDVPVCLYFGGVFFAHPEEFFTYFQDHQKEWTIKRTMLRAPDDPFPIYKKLITSDYWPFPPTDFKEHFYWNEGYALKEILTLVQTAYSPQWSMMNSMYINGLDYDKYHKEFKALGCRWDTEKQMYMRKDGVVLPYPVDDFPQYQYHFRGIPSLDITITFSRDNILLVDSTLIVKELGTKKIRNAILVVENPDSKAELDWVYINDPTHASKVTMTKQKILASPPHKAQSENGATSRFELAKGKRVRFVILYGGKKYASPIYKP